jgi:Protein of unknown function (DUF4038)/Putative collagen-binding domain of a collagenase
MTAVLRRTRRFRLVSAPRRLMLAIGLIFGSLMTGSGARADDTGGAEIGASAGPDAAAAFPLTNRPGRRYLEDAHGRPFLIHGDTAWSLIAQLNREDVDLYLDDRQARGFNTVLVSLLEHHYSANPPANAYDQQPFLTPGDFTTPNEAYFAHADWVLRQAAAKGFLVLLTPSYTGCCGDGWYDEMVANGEDRLRRYGEYLGRRYRHFNNIMWVHAGDADPPRKDLVSAIANGIREVDPQTLHTAHGHHTSALDYWQSEPWLGVNNVYTYERVYAHALEQYARPELMPFFLIESIYENEYDATEQRLRTQAYQAVLSGAAGQVFGNNPIWHFDGRGIHPAPVTWQEALQSRGAQSMTHLHDLLATRPWWLLDPDSDHKLLTDGLGSEDERAVAACTGDGSLAIVYLPGDREITIDLAQLAGPNVAARWYDPADGTFAAIEGSPFSATGQRQFRPDPDNSAGFSDWVLILESHS